MDKATLEFIQNLCKEQSKSLVGKACKEIEVLQAQPNLSKETKDALNLQKSLLKELIYEEFRTIRNAILFYSQGREYKQYPIYNPSKKES